MPDMNHARNRAAACFFGGFRLYVFGGMGEIRDSVEMIDLGSSMWTVLDVKLREEVSCHLSANLKEEAIMIFGGLSCGSISKRVSIFKKAEGAMTKRSGKLTDT